MSNDAVWEASISQIPFFIQQIPISVVVVSLRQTCGIPVDVDQTQHASSIIAEDFHAIVYTAVEKSQLHCTTENGSHSFEALVDPRKFIAIPFSAHLRTHLSYAIHVFAKVQATSILAISIDVYIKCEQIVQRDPNRMVARGRE